MFPVLFCDKIRKEYREMRENSMAWKRYAVSLLCALFLWLTASLPVFAINTVPELPDLQGTTETTSQPAAPAADSSETEYPSAERSGENRIVLIGILAWVGFLVVVGVVAVIVVKSKRRPPGGGSGSGRLGESSPGNEGYKERILSDQHYRKY